MEPPGYVHLRRLVEILGAPGQGRDHHSRELRLQGEFRKTLMPPDLSQRRALIFLREHLQSQLPFTKNEFSAATGWVGATLNTYWSKQFKPFIVPFGANNFLLSVAFRPFLTWKKFQRHVTQNRPLAADYERIEHEIVVIYEFFMPLTNETALRT